MQRGVILLEEVENQMHNFDPAAIDSTLAYHKEALETCTSMLLCQNSATSIEVAMLLALIANKLSQLCEKIVSQLSQQSQRLLKSRTQQRAQGWSSRLEERSGADVPRRNLFLGDYEIDSLMEWVPSMKGLVMVQLRGLHDLATQMKRREQGLSGAQQMKLGNVEREIRKMAARLQGGETRL